MVPFPKIVINLPYPWLIYITLVKVDTESVICDVIKIHLKRKDRGEVRKEKAMDLDIFL